MIIEKKLDDAYAVIMAGGSGTRLWPLSRQNRPKQMLQLVGERTMFQMAVDRLQAIFSPDHVLVVTVADQASKLQDQYPLIPKNNFLIEPMPRGTASVVGLAAIEVQARSQSAGMVVLTADHLIENVSEFQQALLAALEVSRKDFLVTLGISPTFPSTGYGYIQRGEYLGDFLGKPSYRVERFKEKPDEDQARKMLEDGNHDWNSGMFIWKTDSILAEFQKQMPQLYVQLQKIASSAESSRQVTLTEVWKDIKPQTIDYGIMENAIQVAVIPVSNIGWNDVGSWESLFEILPCDENGNIVVQANSLFENSHSSLIVSENKQKLIAVLNVENLVVVDTDDVLFVCERKSSQNVRDLVNALKKSGSTKYL
jgi:mannose-1-phosphate guanylyltransferase